ncbi:nitrite transporter [Providencia sp.]|uniref:nitrite transporter n=1 Tax=Providencia sp. TaxID=589 RepID=UPI003F9E838F
MLNIDKYRSVIWQKGGRTYPNLDCYGIVHEVRKDLGLDEWPLFEGVTKDDNGLDIEAKEMAKKVELCRPKEGAVAACYSGNMITHVAIVISVNGLLQAIECNPKNNITILPLSRFERRFTKVEYYQ